MEESKKEQIQLLLRQSPLYDLRGTLGKALELLPSEIQSRIGCDFAEHLVRGISLPSSKEKLLADAIFSLRAYSEGNETIQQVEDHRVQLHEAMNNPQGADVVYVCAIETVLQAIYSICQRQLEETGVLHPEKYKVSVCDVATQASYAAGQRAVAGHWNVSEVGSAQKARKDASDAETSWQITRLLEDIGG